MYVQVFLNGLSLGALYCMMAIGLCLIFGVMKVITFAHGDLIMVGGFVAWGVTHSGINVPPLLLLALATISGVAAVAGLSLAIERGLYRRLRAKPMAVLMATWGLAHMLRVSFRMIFGLRSRTLPLMFPGIISLLGGSLPLERLILICTASILMGFLWFFLSRTKLGRGIRATSEDREAAALQGINPNRIAMLTWAIAGAFAAVAGVFAASIMTVNPLLGESVIWLAFIAIVVGGAESILGATIAALLLGFINSGLFALGEPALITIVNAVLMLVVLALRPEGLFGRAR